MKLNFKFFILAVLFGSFTQLFAQDHHRCSHDEMYKQLLKENPQLEADYHKLMQDAKQVTIEKGTKRQRYIIPVVFHILHQYGNENISDEQIQDAIAVLNRDFQKQNADTSVVIDEFKGIIGDADIEFRLANIDPWGNCTDGIERIYTHESEIGDNNSKFNQWHRSKYLNIWVSKITNDGAAGWTYKPAAVEGAFFYADGIMILHSYVGRIGTGSNYSSRALTHEIGHWLGLSHTWGDNNDPMIACGDDGIDDTPMTKGYNFCPTPATAKVCSDTIVENYQNYMDYSYCSVMFTQDQVNLMRGVIQLGVASRNTLWVDSTLLATGVMNNPRNVCTPVAAFQVANKFACDGEEITFTDKSWNGAVVSRVWEFENGTPSTSTAASPKVSFNGYGWKKVKLTVTNASGSNTTEVAQSVFIAPNYAEINGPYLEDFNGNVTGWIADNNDANSPGFELTAQNGKDNSKAMVLKNFKTLSNVIPFTDDYFYFDRLGGQIDGLVSPAFDLRYTTNINVSFDYAYSTNAATSADLKEKIRVLVSRNCGKTWSILQTIDKSTLVSGGNSGGADFKPTTNNSWATFTRSFPANNTDDKTRFKIEFTASDFSNNLYIDNFNVSGVLTVAENPLNAMDVEVYPNPTTSNDGIQVSFNANGANTTIDLLDVQGKKLTTQVNTQVNGSVNQKLSLPTGLAAGIYYVNISQGEYNLVKRVVVL